MFVLVEGIDGSGKSTLVKELSNYYTVVAPKRNDKEMFLSLKLFYSDEVMVFDRSILSDMVYRIFDGEEPDCSIFDIMRVLEHSIIIYCKNKNSYKKSIERGEDNIIDKKDSKKLSQIYDTIFSMFKVYRMCDNILEYDYEKDEPDIVRCYIESLTNNEMLIKED